MRIISWFAMFVFLLECNVLSLLGWLGTVNQFYSRRRAYHSMPRKMADARPTHSPAAAIYARRLQKQFSRPMTGHTPRKLPFFNAISRIIAVHAQNVPTRARLWYHRYGFLSRTFLEKFTKIQSNFQSNRRIIYRTAGFVLLRPYERFSGNPRI